MDFSRQTQISSTHRIAPTAVGVLTDWDDDDDRMLRDFVDDISLSAAEMKLFIAMPEFSIADVKNLIADVNDLRSARQIHASKGRLFDVSS